RIAGTVLELNYVASLSQDEITEIVSAVPPYPLSSEWRNRIEELPILPWAMDLVDPFSNKPKRNTAALLMVKQSQALKAYFAEQPATAPFINSPVLDELSRNAEFVRTFATASRLEFVNAPEIRDLLATIPNKEPLRELHLEPILKGFADTLEPVVESELIETN
ncbi:MAG: hypothetical protein AAF357_11585, partial [Verrucomicrobiota bacterium]